MRIDDEMSRSFMDKLRSSLNSLSTNKDSTKDVLSNGRILGHSDKIKQHNNDIHETYEVCFQSHKLGLSVVCSKMNLPQVQLIDDFCDERINIGDTIISCNEQKIISFSQFMKLLESSSRPLVLTFQKDQLSIEQRRAIQQKAALDRSQKWDQKVKIVKNQSKLDSSVKVINDQALSKDSMKAIAAVKKSEEDLQRQLGYNPFDPVLSSSLNLPIEVSSTNSISDNILTTNSSSMKSINESVNELQVSDAFYEEIDEALAVIISFTIDDPNRSPHIQQQLQIGFQTMIKILSNIYFNPMNTKYFTIKIESTALKSKVLSIHGTMNFLLVSGFELEEDSIKFNKKYFYRLDYAIKR